MLGLKPYKEHQVTVISDAVGQMVQDAARFHHPRSGDNYRRRVLRIQRLRLGDITDVLEQRKVEQLVRILDEPLGPVEHLRVHSEDGGDVHRQGTVQVDRYLWNQPGAGEPMQAVDQLLSS